LTAADPAETNPVAPRLGLTADGRMRL
jgi:hypothetical protein